MKAKNIPGVPAVFIRSANRFPEWLSDYPDIHVQIRHLRRSKGVSQESLAAHTGLTWRSIPNIESGKVNPKISTLQKIAEHLDCELKILLIPRSGPAEVRDRPASGNEPFPSGAEAGSGAEDIGPEIPGRDGVEIPEKKKEYFWD